MALRNFECPKLKAFVEAAACGIPEGLEMQAPRRSIEPGRKGSMCLMPCDVSTGMSHPNTAKDKTTGDKPFTYLRKSLSKKQTVTCRDLYIVLHTLDNDRISSSISSRRGLEASSRAVHSRTHPYMMVCPGEGRRYNLLINCCNPSNGFGGYSVALIQ